VRRRVRFAVAEVFEVLLPERAEPRKHSADLHEIEVLPPASELSRKTALTAENLENRPAGLHEIEEIRDT
jgi:hypothetical protein